MEKQKTEIENLQKLRIILAQIYIDQKISMSSLSLTSGISRHKLTEFFEGGEMMRIEELNSLCEALGKKLIVQ